MDVLLLKCDQVKGECTLKDYTDTIQLLSFSHGISQQMTGDQSNQKRTEGKPNHQDISISKYMDISTCRLIDFCNRATVMKKATLIVGQNEDGAVKPIVEYTLHNALVSSHSVGGGGGVPQENITLNYTKIDWVYKQQTAEGKHKGQDSATWDLEHNTGGTKK